MHLHPVCDGYPVVLVSLNDALNQLAVREDSPPYRSSGVIFVCSVVCLPAAIGLIQSTINRALVEAVHTASRDVMP